MTVLAVEQYGAGPFGTLQLAELGAKVIKIEDPRHGGDVGRFVPPYTKGEDSLFFQTFNHNKASLTLDISQPSGYAVFLDMVRGVDAVYSNLRGDIPAKLRLRYDDLKAVNPAIVCVSLSGFGMSGSRASQPAYDYVLQALAGWMELTGEPDGAPTKTGISLVDYSAGILSAFALLAGVHAARRDGVGMDCDLSLYDTAVSMLTYPATWWLTKGHLVGRTKLSAHPSLVPFQNFQTSDGWIVVSCAKEKFWRQLTDALDRPDLVLDERFVDFAARRRNSQELLDILTPIFTAQPTTIWLQKLAQHGVPHAPIRTLDQALSDPFTAERGMILEFEHPEFGRVRVPATAAKVGPRRATPTPAPGLDSDHRTILAELAGYSPERIAALEGDGVLGSHAEPSATAREAV